VATLASHSTRRQAQRANGPDNEPRCPYCGAPLTRKEFDEIRRLIEAEERARIGNVEQNLKERFALEQQQLATKAKTEVEKARREAAAQVVKAKRDAAAREAAIRQEAAKSATAALAPKIAQAVSAEKAKAYTEKLKLTEQLDDMKRRLEKRTAGELGDEAEIDLFDALRREYPIDQIARVPKGRAGGDILHDVVHNGVVVGRVVLDSKNHSRWSSRFISKLASDLIEHRADHAVLSSSVFPTGARQLHVVDGVIIAHPARVVVLVALLRRQIIATHLLKLGNSMRDEKRDELYGFITSDRCTQLLDRIGSLSSDVLELDAKEESSHRTVWKRRSDLIRAIHGVHGEFTAEIERIITGTQTETPA
jgi:hypothetical protein